MVSAAAEAVVRVRVLTLMGPPLDVSGSPDSSRLPASPPPPSFPQSRQYDRDPNPLELMITVHFRRLKETDYSPRHELLISVSYPPSSGLRWSSPERPSWQSKRRHRGLSGTSARVAIATGVTFRDNYRPRALRPSARSRGALACGDRQPGFTPGRPGVSPPKHPDQRRTADELRPAGYPERPRKSRRLHQATRSKTAARPWPPPMHIVSRP